MKHKYWTTHENQSQCSGTRFNFHDNEHDKKNHDTGSEQVNKIGGHNAPLLKRREHLAMVPWRLFCEPSHFFFIFVESCTWAVPIGQEEFMITNKLNIYIH